MLVTVGVVWRVRQAFRTRRVSESCVGGVWQVNITVGVNLEAFEPAFDWIFSI
jgi:hypothetical protein